MNENPFEVLRLDPTTPVAEIVSHAGRLRQQATDEQSLAQIRHAVQALTGSPRDRLLHEVLTHARPEYRWSSLDNLVAQWRRSPVLPLDVQEDKSKATDDVALETAWRLLLFSP